MTSYGADKLTVDTHTDTQTDSTLGKIRGWKELIKSIVRATNYTPLQSYVSNKFVNKISIELSH